MLKKNKTQLLPSPMVVGNGCSSFRSRLFFRGRRRPLFQYPLDQQHPPPPKTPSSSPSSNAEPVPTNSAQPVPPHHQLRHTRSVVRTYWRRVHQLEQELAELEQWLEAETNLLNRLKDSSSRVGIREMDGAEADQDGLLKLADGSYIRKVERITGRRRRSESLVMHVSAPVIAENGSTAFEVMLSMASMGMDGLVDCLTKAMKMDDISGCKMDQIKGKRTTITAGPVTGFMEKIVLEEAKEMEGLAMEGLEVQATSADNTTTEEEDVGRDGGEGCHHDECFVLVMLLQIRDEVQDLEAVGDPMICFIEVSVGEKKADLRCCRVEGAHVAGLKSTGHGGSYKDGFVWSVSLDCRRDKYVRNRNIAFAGK